eukprot:195589_1
MSSISTHKQTKYKDLGFSPFEFLLAALVCIAVHYPMIKQRLNDNEYFLQKEFYGKYKEPSFIPKKFRKLRMQKGYLSSNWMDLTDRQYRIFRKMARKQFIPILIYLSISAIIKYVLRKYYNKHIINGDHSFSKYLVSFYLIFSSIVTIYLHGTTTMFIIVAMGMNYLICQQIYTLKYANIITWILNLLIVFTV